MSVQRPSLVRSARARTLGLMILQDQADEELGNRGKSDLERHSWARYFRHNTP
jgi:hypothetical protein